MPLVVGTDTYVSVVDADTYVTDHFRGDDLTTWDTASDDKEAALREATQYIDANFEDNFVGEIQTTSQTLAWPRVNAVDNAGRLLNGIPSAVKDATVELAFSALGGKLVPDESRGGKVKREKVDVLEVEYFDNAPAGTTYGWVEQLLRPVLKHSGAVKRLFRV